ncbi:MAG: response regulator transcription factor [Bacteroidetes bacterium]|nr:response regulator transcription factor [Bacteroidota bacterium]MBS1540752.1 response regulator transcription factor [Bacteroidota bacterium]
MKTKLFIVDDHFMITEGIKAMLQNESEMEWLGHAYNADTCLSFLQHQLPDVLLMDINLPDKSGIDLCREVNEKYPTVRIIGLSTFNQLSFISKMLDNGAMGYLLKNATKQEVLTAIRTVMQGKNYLSPEAFDMLKKPNVEEAPTLTRREIEVLQLIAEGMTNAEMAEKLFVSATTVDTHRKHLLEKFNAKNTAALIRAAAQMKFV